MAKKRETADTGPLLSQLKERGWFRKINDSVQVGIPDILGCWREKFYGIEVKSIAQVPVDGLVPSGKEHRFSKKQVSELCNIQESNGVAVGVIICGKNAIVVYPGEITDDGQVNWRMIPESRRMFKLKGRWDIKKILEA